MILHFGDWLGGEIGKLGVRGTVSHLGTLLVGATLQICPAPDRTFRTDRGPCGDQPNRKTMLTGPDGGFAFDDLPLGSYGFAVTAKGSDEWTVTGQDFCNDVTAGQICDVGALAF